MNREFEQYRSVRIEGRPVTRAQLEERFKHGLASFEVLERGCCATLNSHAAISNSNVRLSASANQLKIQQTPQLVEVE
jgi:hypothetical protein